MCVISALKDKRIFIVGNWSPLISNQLQAWTGPGGSRRMRLLDSKTTAHEGGKVVSPTHRPPLPPTNIPGTHFC